MRASTRMQLASCLILAATLTSSCCWCAPQQQPSTSKLAPTPQTGAATNKSADLTPLIQETLAINNRTISQPAQSTQNGTQKGDDWTFDMVEYDLMDFLQDLSARYRLANNNKTLTDDSQFRLDANGTTPPEIQSRSDSAEHEASSGAREQQTTTTTKMVNQITSQLPTSLASGDQDMADSKWQYGIFDRFTRPRSTSTTTTPDPFENVRSDYNKQFNSDECGLRTYDLDEAKFASAPNAFAEADDELAIKELNQRRQKPPALSSANFFQSHKKFHQSSMAAMGGDDAAEQTANRHTKEKLPPLDIYGEMMAYDKYDKHLNDQYPDRSFADGSDRDNNVPDSEFNLSFRRQWLQQQIGNTLQMLGFQNSSSGSAAENLDSDFWNQTYGLNMRENMMKMATAKQKRSLKDELRSKDPALDITEAELKSRQDDLKLEARVIGGTDARLGDSPWSVSLQALVSRPGTGGMEYRHYCGGTIISEYYILTAAHCLDFMVGRESRLFVVIGDLNWRMSAGSLHGRRFGIDKLIIHSKYKSTAFGHDIGLIRTREAMKPLKVNGRYIINSVCLPDRNIEHSGEAELVGWGLFSNRNEMADSLQIADVPILPRPLCVDLYRRRTGLIQWLIGVELITEKQICAGTFGRGICQGDSGSALVHNEKVIPRNDLDARAQRRNSRANQSKATIIGVVAFGGIRRCSYQSLPGVYMQTSKYMDWILPRIQSSA